MIYSNTIAEEYAVSAILNSPEDNFPYLKGEQVGQSSFHNFAPKLVWNKCSQLFKEGRIHEIEMLEFSDDIKGSANGRELSADISRIRSLYSGKEFLKQHVKTLKNEEARRKAHIVASNALKGIEGGESPDEVAGALRSGSEAIAGILSSQSDWKSASQSAEEFAEMLKLIHQDKSQAGMPTGITLIDHLTGGLRPSELWVIAAPTSGGKTVLMLQMLASVLKLGKRAVVFSLETDADRLHARLASNTQNIPMGKILGNSGEILTKQDLVKIRDYVEDVTAADKLVICDSDSMTLESIEARLAQMVDAGGDFDCIIIDYIQLVGVSDAKDLARHEQIAKVTRTLKQLSKRYKCPIITASQLNDDGRLRESRAIGHDADTVLMIDPESGTIGVAKNRNGARGDRLPLVMNGAFQRFE